MAAAGGSVVAATVALTLRAPPAGQVGAAFRNAIMDIGPMATGVAAIYSVVACVAKDARGVDDYKNPFMGGMAAGAFAGAVKRRTIPGAMAGALIFAAAAATPYWFEKMAPTLDEVTSKRVDPAASVATPAHFAGTSQAATSLQRRLL